MTTDHIPRIRRRHRWAGQAIRHASVVALALLTAVTAHPAQAPG